MDSLRVLFCIRRVVDLNNGDTESFTLRNEKGGNMAEDTAKIQQETVETPATSQVEEKTPETEVSETDVNEVSSSKPQETFISEEEAKWAKEWVDLKGSTQDRIKQILEERDEARERTTRQAQEDANRVTPPTQAPVGNDEIDQAIGTLKSRGVVTKDDLDNLFYQIKREKDHERLESKYDGSDGLPKYGRQEVNDYMQRKSIWDPEAAFRDMYFDELMDARKVSVKKGVYTEKPSAPSSQKEEPLTAESFQEKLKGPKGREYLEKLSRDPEKFDKIIQQLSQE